MAGPGKSQKKFEEDKLKRHPERIRISRYIRHTDEDVNELRSAIMYLSNEIKLISINKLYTDQKTVLANVFEREKERESEIIERRREQKEHGIIDRKASDVSDPNDQPINVMLKNKRYIVLEGLERVIAKRALGVKKIKARVYDFEKAQQR